jgi:hypothetical protein
MRKLFGQVRVNYKEIFKHGGANCGNEDFDFLKCPFCGWVYLVEWEVETLYCDGNDLLKRIPLFLINDIHCYNCGKGFPEGPWNDKDTFGVSFLEASESTWKWAIEKPID